MKGAQVAAVAFVVAALLALLSIAGLVHAFRTPKDETFAPPEQTDTEKDDSELVSV